MTVDFEKSAIATSSNFKFLRGRRTPSVAGTQRAETTGGDERLRDRTAVCAEAARRRCQRGELEDAPAGVRGDALDHVAQLDRQSSVRFCGDAFSASLSNVRSATRCFGRRFSSSSCFRRRAPLTALPPNLAF